MGDLYNRVAMGNDQRFDHHILGSPDPTSFPGLGLGENPGNEVGADHLSGTATKEMH